MTPQSRLLVLSGIPGAGKSHYAQHLQQSHGWRWIEDDHRSGKPEPPESKWRQVATSWRVDSNLVTGFIEFVSQHGEPVVVEYGFGVGELPVISLLRQAGATAWWFDGDPDACLKAWRDRWPGAPDDVWHRQHNAIRREWHNIAAVYRPNIITTRSTAGVLAHEDIDAIVLADRD